MEKMGISDISEDSFSALSGGQRQRVILARALCAAEKILLLDEPVTGLDPIVSAELYESVAALNKKRGVAVIMVSHDIAGAVKYSDKILHIGSGAEFFGTTEEYIASDLGKRFSGRES